MKAMRTKCGKRSVVHVSSVGLGLSKKAQMQGAQELGFSWTASS
jgi:hypothetical protein